jgi:hypothetical protein
MRHDHVDIPQQFVQRHEWHECHPPEVHVEVGLVRCQAQRHHDLGVDPVKPAQQRRQGLRSGERRAEGDQDPG